MDKAKPDTRAKQSRKGVGKTTRPLLPRIELPPSLTVKQMADSLKIEPAKAIKQLMRHGIMANINQTIDFNTAAVIVHDFGCKAEQKIEQQLQHPHKIEAGKKLQARPPVITVMGHVDHGKTTLLDAIRKTSVTAHEAGAITQHIGAYQTVVEGRKITFLDTPGHKAFTAMRSRGARATDIVVLVVAADDGVMPQTVEAANHAKAAGIPIVVAINKIDKSDADIDRTKQQLTDLGLVIEDWGGDIVCVPISAKQGQGVADLLENLFLVADIQDLKADPTCPAEGFVIEAKLDKSRGPLATLLVQKGTLNLTDFVTSGSTWGRVKAMFDDKGRRVKKAEPSTPVEVLGLNGVPSAGELFTVVSNEQQARSIAGEHETRGAIPSLSLSSLSSQISDGQIKDLNIVLKTDVQGSIEPIKNSIEQLSVENVKTNIIHAASGSITESDVLLASASRGIIIGFNTGPAPGTQQLAEAEGVSIHRYDVIYRLEEDVDKALKGMLEPTYAEVLAGRAEVKAIFPSSKQRNIAGVSVKEGKLSRGAKVKILRQNKLIRESRISSLRRFKEDVTEVATGLECGVTLEGFNNFNVGDIIELYRTERVN